MHYFIPFFCLFFLEGSIGNVMVCAVVYKNQRMQTAMNLFLVNLAVWDILVCLFNIPFTLIYNQLKSWPFGLFWCKTMPSKWISWDNSIIHSAFSSMVWVRYPHMSRRNVMSEMESTTTLAIRYWNSQEGLKKRKNQAFHVNLTVNTFIHFFNT